MTHNRIRNAFIVVCFMVGAGFCLSGIFGHYANNMARIIAGALIMIYEVVMWQAMNINKTKIKANE